MKNEENLRDRNHERTRAALIDAAQELFVQKGYDATTVDEIAALAGVSRRTLFRYFPSKEQLALADGPPRLARFRKHLARLEAEETPLAAVRRALMLIAREHMEDDEALVTTHRIIEGSPTLIGAELAGEVAWEDAIAEALLARVAASEANELWARTMAGAIYGAVRVLMRRWYASGGEADVMALGRTTFDVLEHGFQGPPDESE